MDHFSFTTGKNFTYEFALVIPKILTLADIKSNTKVIGFKSHYGCRAEKYSGHKSHAYFSNWYPSKFTVGYTITDPAGTRTFRSNEFTCAEQFMMYVKAILFDDGATAEKIISLKYFPDMISYQNITQVDKLWDGTAAQFKSLCRTVENFDPVIGGC